MVLLHRRDISVRRQRRRIACVLARREGGRVHRQHGDRVARGSVRSCDVRALLRIRDLVVEGDDVRDGRSGRGHIRCRRVSRSGAVLRRSRRGIGGSRSRVGRGGGRVGHRRRAVRGRTTPAGGRVAARGGVGAARPGEDAGNAAERIAGIRHRTRGQHAKQKQRRETRDDLGSMAPPLRLFPAHSAVLSIHDRPSLARPKQRKRRGASPSVRSSPQ